MIHDHDSVEDIEDLVRSRGQRITPQRRLVLEIMQNSHGHLTVEDVVAEATRRNHEVSIASVYRILGWLTDHHVVCVTDTGGRDLAYEYLGNRRHHHLICQTCGEETEIPYSIIDPMVTTIRTEYGFEPRIDHQAIFGTCSSCQTQTSIEGR